MISEAVRVKKIKDAVKTLEKSAAALTEAALDLSAELDLLLDSPYRFDLVEGFDFYEAVQRFEVGLIECALLETSFNQAKAARLLGINHTTLNQKIKRYKLNKRYTVER